MTNETLDRAIEIRNDIEFLKKQTISVGISKRSSGELVRLNFAFIGRR